CLPRECPMNRPPRPSGWFLCPPMPVKAKAFLVLKLGHEFPNASENCLPRDGSKMVMDLSLECLSSQHHPELPPHTILCLLNRGMDGIQPEPTANQGISPIQLKHPGSVSLLVRLLLHLPTPDKATFLGGSELEMDQLIFKAKPLLHA
ncbi:hypothetical protein SK128_020906, partial [Halocaridina rubra]